MHRIFADYPDWLVVAVGTLVASAALWILIKVLRWALWLLVFGVLFCGLAAAVWLFFQ